MTKNKSVKEAKEWIEIEGETGFWGRNYGKEAHGDYIVHTRREETNLTEHDYPTTWPPGYLSPPPPPPPPLSLSLSLASVQENDETGARKKIRRLRKPSPSLSFLLNTNLKRADEYSLKNINGYPVFIMLTIKLDALNV